MSLRSADCIVIGGGFYGCSIASYVARMGLSTILVEADGELCTRASYTNQARVHGGYHYPRSIVTALRSQENYPRFIADFEPAIKQDFTSIYAIARLGSRVTPAQFSNFCDLVGCPIEILRSPIRDQLDFDFIAEAFEVRESAFDIGVMRDTLLARLNDAAVKRVMGNRVETIQRRSEHLEVCLASGRTLFAAKVFLATYASLNEVLTRSGLPVIPLIHEWVEMALMDPPPEIDYGITVMDGPFFSFMPFPAERCYSLSHVSFTPHQSWTERHRYLGGRAASAERKSNRLAMLKDASRFQPSLARARYRRSLWDVKTVLPRSSGDDSRPILFRRNHGGCEGLHVVLGGKIDNIYDCFDAIDKEPL